MVKLILTRSISKFNTLYRKIKTSGLNKIACTYILFKKFTRFEKMTKNIKHKPEKNKSIEKDPEINQRLELSNKVFEKEV